MGMEPIRYETRRRSVCAAHDHSGEGEFAAFYRASGPDFYWNLISRTIGWIKAALSGKAHEDDIYSNGVNKTWIIQ